MKYVAGEVCGKNRLIDLLAAAMEKFRFAPHCGQCEVPTPASDPHFGQMRGRCAAGSE